MLDLTACVLLLALAFIEPPTDGQVQVNQSWRSRLSWSLFYNHVHLFFVGTFLGAHYYRNHCLDGYRSGKCFKNALVRLENFYPLPEVYGEMRNSSRHASGSNRYSDRTNDIFPGDARLASHISIQQLLLLWFTTLSSTGKWPARSLHANINCIYVFFPDRQILQSVLPALEILLLLLFVMLFFSVLGFFLFDSVPNDTNFTTLRQSFISLFVLLTTAK